LQRDTLAQSAQSLLRHAMTLEELGSQLRASCCGVQDISERDELQRTPLALLEIAASLRKLSAVLREREVIIFPDVQNRPPRDPDGLAKGLHAHESIRT
jgi:hypothetical protein